MIFDAMTSVSSGGVLRGDVCIVGAGAAGITPALALRGRGLSVLARWSGSSSATDRRARCWRATGSPASSGSRSDYLVSKGIRYVAYVESEHSTYLYRREIWFDHLFDPAEI